MQRQYTISEIDQMRYALRELCKPPIGQCYRESDINAEAEDQLRTHMLNGTAPEDLTAACRKRYERDAEAASARMLG